MKTDEKKKGYEFESASVLDLMQAKDIKRNNTLDKTLPPLISFQVKQINENEFDKNKRKKSTQ